MVQIDKEVDALFMEFLAQHFPNEEDKMFVGPDTGANDPIYFYSMKDLPKRYPMLKKILPTIRATAGLYATPNRSLYGIEKAWCLAMDFDYDRGEWAGIKRTVQDTTIFEFCSWIIPTAAVRTRNGWHLYWVLDKPMSSFDYAYPASLIKATLRADSRSILPTQCLNFYNTDPKKPAVMVDTITLDSIGKEIPVFPRDINYYRVQDIKVALGKNESESLKALRQAVYHKYQPVDMDFDAINRQVAEDTTDILEHYDVAEELNKAGYKAYNRYGGKIVCCCPFHNDRNPSAYIDVNPDSNWFGRFFCTSTSCKKSTTLKNVMKEIGVI